MLPANSSRSEGCRWRREPRRTTCRPGWAAAAAALAAGIVLPAWAGKQHARAIIGLGISISYSGHNGAAHASRSQGSKYHVSHAQKGSAYHYGNAGSGHAEHHGGSHLLAGPGPAGGIAGADPPPPVRGAAGTAQSIVVTWLPGPAGDDVAVTWSADTFLQIDLTELSPGGALVAQAALTADAGLSGSVAIMALAVPGGVPEVSVELSGVFSGVAHAMVAYPGDVVALEFPADLVWTVPGDYDEFTLAIDGEIATGTGACCTASGCSVETLPDCAALGGQYLGDGRTCGSITYDALDCQGAFEDIARTGTSLPACDDCGTAVPVGFPFSFFGETFGMVTVSSNGYLTFGDTGSDATNDCPLPAPAAPNRVIAAAWTDLDPGAAGSYQYETRGAAPARRFIAQWTEVPGLSPATLYTVQAILFEGTNDIELRYASVGMPVSCELSIGVESAAGAAGLNIAETSVADGSCLRLVAAGCPSAVTGDVTGDGVVDVNDLIAVILGWGLCAPAPCAADADGDGTVNVDDLILVVLNWSA